MKKTLATITALLLLPLMAMAQFKNPGYHDLGDSEEVAALKRHVSFLASAVCSCVLWRLPNTEKMYLIWNYMTVRQLYR